MKRSPRESIGAFVARLRRVTGMTQQELADAIRPKKAHRAQIARIESRSG